VSEIAFYGLAALTVIAAVGVILMRNPVHSAMSLVLALFLIGIQYIALQAHLIAALQIIVYAGAVMVLFLFVIMLLNLQAPEHPPVVTFSKVLGALAAAALAVLLGRAVWSSSGAAAQVGPDFGTTKALARVLFTDDVVAFELTSLLLLVAVVGAIVLARRERA